MPLLPSRVKFRKQHTRSFDVNHKASRGTKVSYGEYGIQALEGGNVTSRQIESARLTATHYLGRVGKMWIRVFPHTPVTARPADTRMGKGKGGVDHWTARVRPGTVLFELAGVSEDMAREAFRLAARKLPFKTTFVTKQVM